MSVTRFRRISRAADAFGRCVGQVYCEMGLNGGGYTFINPQDLATLTNAEVQAMFTDKTDFLMRVRHVNSTQPYAVLQQLDQFRCKLQSRCIICVLEKICDKKWRV